MKFKLLLILSIFSKNIYANNIEHLAFQSFYKGQVTKVSDQKVIDLGRTRSQDGLGNCFAFSLSKRLDHICNQSKYCNLLGEEVSIIELVKAGNSSLKIVNSGQSGLFILKKLNHNPKKTNQINLTTFLNKILIQEKCNFKNNKINIPPFSYENKPTRTFNSPTSLIKKITSLINQNIPPELILCASPKDENGNRVCGLHAVVINGYREACLNSICRKEFKVQNSFGQSWNNNNNAGWVDAEILAIYSLNRPDGENKVLPGKNIENQLNWLELSNL